MSKFENSNIWVEWDNNTMGDGFWTAGEEYSDLNGNGQYDKPEPFLDYGLDGCPDEYEAGEGLCNDIPDPLLYFEDFIMIIILPKKIVHIIII